MEFNLVITENAIIDSEGNTYLETDNTLWLRKGDVFDIEGESLTVTNVNFNTQLTVISNNGGSFFVEAGTYMINNPFFYRHGTIRSVDNELSQINDTELKYPLVYLFERFEEDLDLTPNAGKDRDSPLRIFFLNNYNVNDYTNDDHYNDIVKPMTNTLEVFIQTLNDSLMVHDLTSAKVTSYVKFGTYSSNSGSIKNLVRDNLTGVELRITIPFLKKCC